MLKNDWPFVEQHRPTRFPPPANPVEEIALAWFAQQLTWNDAMQKAADVYQKQGNLVEAARVRVNLADAFVTSAAAQFEAGRALLRTNQADRGLHYLRRAVRVDSAKVEYQLSLAQAQFMLGRAADSAATLEAILEQHPGDDRARYWLGEVRRKLQGG